MKDVFDKLNGINSLTSMMQNSSILSASAELQKLSHLTATESFNSN